MVKNKYLETSGYDSSNKSIEDVLKQEYDNILYGEYWRGVLFVEKNGLYGVISISGDEIVPCKYAEYSDARHEWADMGFATEKTKVITPEQKILAEQRLALEQAKIEEEKKQSKQEDMETVDNLKKSLNESDENWEIPRDLKEYRKKREERIHLLGNRTAKEQIIQTCNKIPMKVKTESDGSRLIEFAIWWKTRKILIPNLVAHSDFTERRHESDPYCVENRFNVVLLRSMLWDDIEGWTNQELKEFVKQKEGEWLHIPSENEMKELLAELWKQADLYDRDTIAMLMYLTGMNWTYRLTAKDSNSRYRLVCRADDYRQIEWDVYDPENRIRKYGERIEKDYPVSWWVLMIACE